MKIKLCEILVLKTMWCQRSDASVGTNCVSQSPTTWHWKHRVVPSATPTWSCQYLSLCKANIGEGWKKKWRHFYENWSPVKIAYILKGTGKIIGKYGNRTCVQCVMLNIFISRPVATCLDKHTLGVMRRVFRYLFNYLLEVFRVIIVYSG